MCILEAVPLLLSNSALCAMRCANVHGPRWLPLFLVPHAVRVFPWMDPLLGTNLPEVDLVNATQFQDL